MIYNTEIMNNFNSLAQNAILLFALGFFFSATPIDTKTNVIKKQILYGVIIGAMAYFIILSSFVLEEGLFFDSRTILLSVTALFFGGFTTIVSASIAIIFRLIIGGSGVVPGVLTIIVSVSIGYSWKHIRKILPKLPYYIEYLLFGLIVHVVVLMCFLTLPWPTALNAISKTAFVYLFVFPIVTMFLSLFLLQEKLKFQRREELKKQKILLQASIDSTSEMEIFAVDLDYNYLSFNKFHRESLKTHYNINITLKSNFVKSIKNEVIKARIKHSLDRALQGERFKVIVEVEDRNGCFLEEAYAPIYDENRNIYGATIFIEDITLKKQYENSILELSYKDTLTGLVNRRKHQKQLLALNFEKYHPISIVFFDINGLKVMNDAFGHAEGDRLIKLVANKLVTTFEKHKAYVSRQGGDEFVVLCPNTKIEEARILADKAKAAIEKEEINNLQVSISYGASEKHVYDAFSDVINLAETFLYQNKINESTLHRNQTIQSILKALKIKDENYDLNSKNIAEICNKIGMKLGMTKPELSQLKDLSYLHDIGEISIKDEILNKTLSLTNEEWATIKRHPETGYRILSTLTEYRDILEDVLSHHERYDGKGYPRGLQKDEIPLKARILSIADAFNAMTSNRPYRQKMKKSDAIKEIIKNKGSQFDPEIVDVFLTIYSNNQENRV